MIRCLVLSVGIGALAPLTAFAQVIPNEVQQPGTQPGEVTNSQDSNFCNNCHGNYDAAVEPYRNWLGGPMAHATRDPLFWAATAIAEQDFPGSGDLCLRCHTPLGWLDGRSSPTDGSGLAAADFDGVSCHICHRLTDPDRSEHLGVQNAPFVANDGATPATAYLGGGMYVLWGGNHRLGPYSTSAAPHPFLGSTFHRSSDLCGTCHDVSNPVTGDLAHNNGAQQPLSPGTFSGVPGTPVDLKAAFNNFPYQYGVVERTFSEHRSTPISTLPMSSYATLPSDLKAGAIARAYDAATATTPSGNYVDGAQRTFTCQTCHMPPVTGKGANTNSTPVRTDLPHHDMTGGNYWVNDAIKWLDAQNRLVGGGGLNASTRSAMDAGALRARTNLTMAAALTVDAGGLVRVTNLTGHKLISGYPEGRRMWLRTRWYDALDVLVREDGAYGLLAVQLGGQPLQVATLLDPDDPHTRVYETETGLTQEWAQQLLALGASPSLALEYDRVSGQPVFTLGQLGAQPPGSSHRSFHFVLSNTTIADNRIPPWRMSYDEAHARNILPVPESQYGNPGPGGVYRHWDELQLAPPQGASRAVVELLYQPTSWEYVQFLRLANSGASANLATVGQDLLDVWLATGMAAPEVMATAAWDVPFPASYCTAGTTTNGCTASISASSHPSLTSARCTVSVVDVEGGQSGLVFYGLAPNSSPWGSGPSFLCVKTPLERTGAQNAGGTLGTCDGVLALDWDLFQATHGTALGQPWLAGSRAYLQGWFRDPPAPKTTNMSDALELIYQP